MLNLTAIRTVGDVLRQMPRDTVTEFTTGNPLPEKVAHGDRIIRRTFAKVIYRHVRRLRRPLIAQRCRVGIPYRSNTADAQKARLVAELVKVTATPAGWDAVDTTSDDIVALPRDEHDDAAAEAKRLHKNEMARKRRAAAKVVLVGKGE